MPEGNNEGDFPNLAHQPSEREVPGTPWSSVGHAGMFFQYAGTKLELLEPALLSGTGTEPEPPVHLLGAEAVAVYHNKLCVSLRSLRLCGQHGDDVGKKSRMECDATTRRSAAASASETNRAPGRTAKLAQRSRSYVGFGFIKVTVLFTGPSGAVRMTCASCAGDSRSISYLSMTFWIG